MKYKSTPSLEDFVHNLYQEDNLKGVDVKDYFVKLIRGLFDSYNIRNDQIELKLEIEPLNQDVDTVVPIGLVVNELVSNSLKYAFPSKSKGMIMVSLYEKDDVLIIRVEDDRMGMTTQDIDGLGASLGYRLIKVLQEQLQAELTMDGSDGTSIEMHSRKYQIA